MIEQKNQPNLIHKQMDLKARNHFIYFETDNSLVHCIIGLSVFDCT